MKKEVSCRAFDIVLRDLKRRKLDPGIMIEGTGVDLALLRNKHERIEWSTYVQIMANTSKFYSENDYMQLGGAFFLNPLVRAFTVPGRLFLTARDFYLWMGKQEGSGNQPFPCIQSVTKDVAPSRLQIELTLPEGYADCRAFFLITKGALTNVPRLLGLAPSEVRLEFIPRGARYHVVCPPGGGILQKLKRAILFPFVARTMARELQESNVQLLERHQQLEEARKVLDRQATALRTAHAISQVVHGDLDLAATLSAVAHALVERAGFARAEIEVATEVEGRSVAQRTTHGSSPGGLPPLSIPLSASGRTLGTMHLWAAPDAEPAGREELLEYVTPTVTMAIDDALKYTAVVDYRASLEEKVVARTEELRQARDTLAQTVVELKAAQEARNRLFANINHEIRTPLSVIMMAAERVQSLTGAALPDKAREALDGINHNARRLLHLVDGLLLLAAGQEGKLRLKPAPHDLGALLRQQVDAWRAAAERMGLAIEYNGPKRCMFRFDEAAIERVLANLLSNALKFTPAGGSIEILVTERDQEIEIAVRDTGIGIDEEFKTRIFQRFEQGRAPVRRGAASSGIGLAIVKELVEAHGGHIEVGANRGGGTVFNVTLPRAPAVPTEEPTAEQTKWRVYAGMPEGIDTTPPPADPPRVLDLPGPKEATILLAEDDPTLRQMTGELLQGSFRVLMAPDGLSALRLAREHAPDLLLADVGMPGMDGFELTRRFRELPGARLAPIILLTAYGHIRDRIEGLDAGAVDYVLKPFEPAELLARIRNHLAQRNLALKLHETESLASLGMLSAGLAHEIRNPANALVNAVQPLRRMLPPQYTEASGPTGQLLSVIQDCAAQIGRLSRDLLGLGKPAMATGEPEPITKIVDKSLLVAQPFLKDVTVRKKLEYNGSLHCALGLVVQAVVNLLENGAHAAGPDGWVELRTMIKGDRVYIEVEDSGPGVPRDLRQRIFTPFFTTKSPGRGTGLGLPTSRTIALQHGGDLVLVDTTGGAVFRLDLPVAGQPLAAAGKAENATRSAVS